MTKTMTKTGKSFFAAALVAILQVGLISWSAPAQAVVVLVEYNVNGSNSAVANAVSPIIAAPGVVTASQMTFTNSHGLQAVNAGSSFLWRRWQGTNANRYFEWTVTPEAGHEIQYTHATLPLATGGGDSSNWELLGSTDGFTSSSISFGSVAVSGNGPPNFFGYNISSLGPQTSAVTFRLFGSGAFTNTVNVGGLAGAALGGNNGFIEGTATFIPEPGALALFGFGLAGLGFARRKRLL
jgi:hypothetical protein